MVDVIVKKLFKGININLLSLKFSMAEDFIKYKTNNIIKIKGKIKRRKFNILLIIPLFTNFLNLFEILIFYNNKNQF
jgi:hypothetical protein